MGKKLKLVKAGYGLPSSGRRWQITFEKDVGVRVEDGKKFKKTFNLKSHFYKKSKVDGERIVLTMFVDDGLICGPKKDEVLFIINLNESLE